MQRPGQAHVVITQESIAAMNSFVRENRQITTLEIADSLSVSKGTVDTILHEHLQYNKVCAQWVPQSVPLSLGHALYNCQNQIEEFLSVFFNKHFTVEATSLSH
jgi:hypothetical protein